jgi:PilZ domain-containing protein
MTQNAFYRRREPRYLVRLIGTILTEPTAPQRYCLIEDLSHVGLRICTTSDFHVSDVFNLRFAEKEAKYTVAWRSAQLVGAALIRRLAGGTRS